MSLPKIIFSFAILFSVYLFIPKYSYAVFDGGINIGDLYRSNPNAVQEVIDTTRDDSWIYLMMNPSDKETFDQLLNNYKDARFIIRGHIPDNRGGSLTAENARNWATFFSDLPPNSRIYFVPVNEPNNPNESNGGIDPQIVTTYVLSLINEFNNQKSDLHPNGLLADDTVMLLSPALDIFQFADGPVFANPQNYANRLGEGFFSLFDGIALNLYGQFRNDKLDALAPPIKKGQEYRQFLTDYLGISASQAPITPIFAVETGAVIAGQRVRYSQNHTLITDYFNQMREIWGRDPNFIMYSIFSYDPDATYNPNRETWIYSPENGDVLVSMGYTDNNTVTPEPIPIDGDTSGNVYDFMYKITQRSNKRLLPQTIQEKITTTENTTQCILGLKVADKCLLGEIQGQLIGQTQQFQPIYVPSSKVVDIEEIKTCTNLICSIGGAINDIFEEVVPPQMSDKTTGSLNTYCPSRLNCNQQGGNIASNNSSVEAAQTNKTQEVINSYNLTMKMLLPNSIGGAYANIPAIESPTPVPTSQPQPTISTTPPVFPSTTPFRPPEYRCSTGKEYCSVDFLKDYFPEDAVLEASMICNAESGSDPMSVNKNCLKNKTLDYSIGLFQINLLVHCPNSKEIFEFEYGQNWCTVLDQEKADICEKRFLQPLENIKYAAELYNDQGWDPWSTADYCGIDTKK